MPSYFDTVTARLDELIPGNDPALIRFYALLVLTESVNTGREEVHDAWSAWKAGDGWGYGPVKDADAMTHPSLVPFEDLPEEVAALDDPYVEAIRTVAAERAAVLA